MWWKANVSWKRVRVVYYLVSGCFSQSRGVRIRLPRRRIPFCLSDGSTCEMYWLSADSKERLPEEQWADYSRRSCSEVKQNFERLMSETNFNKDASPWNLSSTMITFLFLSLIL